MKNFIFLLAFLPLISYGKTVSYWYTKSDSLAQGEQSYVAVKYDAIVNFSATDTLEVKLFCSVNCPSGGTPVFKISMLDLDTITKHPDGTTWIYFTVPLNYNIGNCLISTTWGVNDPTVYVRSKNPDVSMISWASGNASFGLSDTTLEMFSIVIDYTFKPTISDSLKIFIGDSIVYNNLYKKKLSFHVPNFIISGNYNLTIVGWNSFLTLNITKTNHVVSGLLDPIFQDKSAIHYYNIQGEEIQKPTEGFYIWKTESGVSGKAYIN